MYTPYIIKLFLCCLFVHLCYLGFAVGVEVPAQRQGHVQCRGKPHGAVQQTPQAFSCRVDELRVHLSRDTTKNPEQIPK